MRRYRRQSLTLTPVMPHLRHGWIRMPFLTLVLFARQPQTNRSLIPSFDTATSEEASSSSPVKQQKDPGSSRSFPNLAPAGCFISLLEYTSA